MAVDMLIWADSCDRIVLLSGDSDFTYSLEALPRKAVFTELLSFEALTAASLRRVSQKFTNLTEALIDIVLEPKTVTSQPKVKPSESALWDAKGIEPERIKDQKASWHGILLERALRDLCKKHNIPVASNDGLDALNNRLAKAKVYPRLTQKKITVWGEIRNNAVHGHFDEYTERDVEEMVKWVSDFMKTHHH